MPFDYDDIGPKVEYVKSQGQTRDHQCHWPNCDVHVPPAMWGCRKHWYKLPSRLRHRIWMAYQQGQEVDGTPSQEYVKAAREIQNWIRQNFPQG